MALSTRPIFGGADSLGNVTARGGPSVLGQKALLSHGGSGTSRPSLSRKSAAARHAQAVSAALLELDHRSSVSLTRANLINPLQVSGVAGGSLPQELYNLLDPLLPVALPPGQLVDPRSLDNRELDKLVAALGRSKATWRRALVLHEWLLEIGHEPDDRLCTSLMRVCQQHGQVVTALSLYEWMRADQEDGGAGLSPTVFTYTIAMRAALGANMIDKALKVWDDAVSSGCQPDCRMCTTLIEVAARKGDTVRALQMYDIMHQQVIAHHVALAKGQRTDATALPSVHAYTAAMRAADEGGLWQRALEIWDDMSSAGIKPTGHAYAAVISACATGGSWQRALQLFDAMIAANIEADVVSCTALISALGAEGQWERAERVVEWMVRTGIKPNVRTYTALVTALANAQQWSRAHAVLQRMKRGAGPSSEPNAYTYSAVIKAMGQHGQWQMAEQLFSELEDEALVRMGQEPGHALVPPKPWTVQPPTPPSSAGSSEWPLPDSQTHHSNILHSQEALAASALQRQNLMVHSSNVAAAAQPWLVNSGRKVSNGRTNGMSSSTEPSHLVRPSAPVAVPSALEGHSSLRPGAQGASQPAASVPPSPTNYSAVPLAAAELVLASMDDDDEAVDGQHHEAQLTHANHLGNVPPIHVELDAQQHAADSSSNTQRQHLHEQLAAGLDALRAAAPPIQPAHVEHPHTPGRASVPSHGVWQAHTAATSGLHLPHLWQEAQGRASGQPHTPHPTPHTSPARPVTTGLQLRNLPPMSLSSMATRFGLELRDWELRSKANGRAVARSKGPVNEVVCGALMSAYERAGHWERSVAVLQRAERLGVTPNTVMYNVALSALGKAGQITAVEKLFAQVAEPDAVTFETLIGAYGMAGKPEEAELVFNALLTAGYAPKDFAYCGLVAAYSMAGNLSSALHVEQRARAAGVPMSVHLYNALIAACERAGEWDGALQLQAKMQQEHVTPNPVTRDLMVEVGRKGAAAMEGLQVMTTALSAAVAAAGGVLMQTGYF